ncbi:hypothetical protein KP509_37G061200 [Ceratopteris richardii]|nr:hypothetical protein KP509_37G061200 [Ceratopteris richardii]
MEKGNPLHIQLKYLPVLAHQFKINFHRSLDAFKQHLSHCSSHHHSEYSTSSSGNADMDSPNSLGEAKKKDSLIVQLDALCKADPDDQEALHALEILVQEIKPSDDPEGLLLGASYLKLATVCASSCNENIFKGLSYAQKATEVYKNLGPSLKLATCFYISALICTRMGETKKAVAYLEESDSVMKRIKVTSCDEYCVALKHDVQSVMGEACDLFCNEMRLEIQSLFGTAKMQLGMHAEAIIHIHKTVKLKQKLLQAGSPDLGAFYLDTAETLRLLNDHKTATNLCSKALKIILKFYGSSSREEAKVRSLLSKIYCDLGKYEESLSETDSARKIWMQLGEVDEVISLNVNAERLLVRLERWTEAVARLDEVIEATRKGDNFHTIALVLAARVFLLVRNSDMAHSYCKRALEALEYQGPCSQTAHTLLLLSIQYEDRKEFDEAATLCKKAKEIFDQCLGQEAAVTAAELEGKLGCILMHAGKPEEAIPYLESSFSRLNCVPNQDLLYIHFYLGLAYPHIQKLKESVQHLEAAKGALSTSTNVSTSMEVAVHSNLATAYSALDKLDEAVECQKVVVGMLQKNDVKDYSLKEAEARLHYYIRELTLSKDRVGKA